MADTFIQSSRPSFGRKNVWQKGQSGNPRGRRKGSVNWADIVQDLLADPKMLDAILKDHKKPEWLDRLPTKRRNAGYAIAMSMIIESLEGNQKAAEWLRKTGFGDMHKLEVSNPVENILQQYGLDSAIEGEVVPRKQIEPGEPAADQG
jgi:hypothetical protein